MRKGGSSKSYFKDPLKILKMWKKLEVEFMNNIKTQRSKENEKHKHRGFLPIFFFPIYIMEDLTEFQCYNLADYRQWRQDST